MNDDLMRGISDLDLDWMAERLMQPPSLMLFRSAKIPALLDEYRKFLALKRLEPDKTRVVPSCDVDEVWHLHILNTRRYAEDCERIFGFYLHHDPSFGETPEGRAALESAWESTAALYRQHFGDDAFRARGEHWREHMFCG